MNLEACIPVNATKAFWTDFGAKGTQLQISIKAVVSTLGKSTVAVWANLDIFPKYSYESLYY